MRYRVSRSSSNEGDIVGTYYEMRWIVAGCWRSPLNCKVKFNRMRWVRQFRDDQVMIIALKGTLTIGNRGLERSDYAVFAVKRKGTVIDVGRTTRNANRPSREGRSLRLEARDGRINDRHGPHGHGCHHCDHRQ